MWTRRMKLGRRSLSLFLAGVVLLGAVDLLPAQEKKSAQVATATSAAAPVPVPEMTRIAVFQSLRGEQVLRSPLAMVLDDKSGDIIVSSFESGEVVVLDKNGATVKRMGADVGLVSPYGVAMDGRGRIYVSEVRSGLIKILSPSGTLVDEIDLSRVMGKTVTPGRITLDKNGLIYVADLNSNQIVVVNGKGGFVRSFGEFDYLQRAAAVGDGRVVGLSAQGKAVKVFNGEGGMLRSFGEHGDSSGRSVSFPTGFALDAKGRLWVVDAFQHRLKVFSLDGNFLFNFGRLEEDAGGFFFPVDACFDNKGRLFVLEKGANRIQIFQVGDLGGAE